MPIFILTLLFSSLLRAEETPFRFVILSDMNASYGSTTYSKDVVTAVKKTIELKPDVVLSTGDMVAGQKTDLTNHAAMWSSFHAVVTAPLIKAGLSFAVTPGNHDGSAYPNFKKERELFKSEWKKFKPKLNFLDDQFYPEYYSFIVKGALFISLDTTIIGNIPEKQMNWLKSELAKRTDYKVKILFAHVPLFPFAMTKGQEHFNDKRLEMLMQEHKVSFFLSGHNHAYYPGFKEGVFYVGQGCLGSGPRTLIGDTSTSPKSMTVIDYDGKNFKIQALTAPTFNKVLDHETLPKEIPHDEGSFIREDLVPLYLQTSPQ